MRLRAFVVGLVYWLGVIALLGALGLVAYAQVAPAEGLQDLGRIVGAMLLVGVGGALLGGSMLLAWALGVEPGGWRLALGTFGAILAAIVGFGLLGTAIPSNVGLAVFAGVVAALAVGGIVASVRLWRGGPMVA